ncbi:hypothetical protein EYF80_010831 [Liparis tanakae]|uniref:Uncharacterized protein n=1 Tax=Liparis tanakae TaxID=230148 RepID=A0A4Z2IM23_9TELE|nr:hypothetical protein EYF80_010831 [Liparis tanakae]
MAELREKSSFKTEQVNVVCVPVSRECVAGRLTHGVHRQRSPPRVGAVVLVVLAGRLGKRAHLDSEDTYGGPCGGIYLGGSRLMLLRVEDGYKGWRRGGGGEVSPLCCIKPIEKSVSQEDQIPANPQRRETERKHK